MTTDTSSATTQRTPLPYKTPLDIWRAFRSGVKFVLHYHGKTYDVTRMEPNDKIVFVQPPSMAVKVFPDGSGNESTRHIWLEHRESVLQAS